MASIDKTRPVTTSELSPIPPMEDDYASRNMASGPPPSYFYSQAPGPSETLGTANNRPSPFPQNLPFRPERTTWSERVKPNARSCMKLHYRTFSCKNVQSHRARARRVMMCFLLAWRLAAFAFMVVYYVGFISSFDGNGGITGAVLCPMVLFFGVFVSAWAFSLMEKAVEDRRVRASGTAGGKVVDWYIHTTAFLELVLIVFCFFLTDGYNLVKFFIFFFFILADVAMALIVSKPPAVNTMV